MSIYKTIVQIGQDEPFLIEVRQDTFTSNKTLFERIESLPINSTFDITPIRGNEEYMYKLQTAVNVLNAEHSKTWIRYSLAGTRLHKVYSPLF